MKASISISIILTMAGFVSVAQNAEKEAIKRIVMLETESYLGVDQAAWTDTWLHASYAYWSFSDSLGTQFVDGWENIQKTFDPYFKTQKPSRSKITYTWQEIRVYTNGAYVRFIEKHDDNRTIEESNQVRVLEKKDGKWKLICMTAVVK